MKTIVAIGGGELGELETLAIDKQIVKMSRKKVESEKYNPKVLFIPTASNDAEGYCDTFKKVYSDKLNCRVDFLLLTKEKLSKKTIADKILSSDIIYVGGGDTLKMLKIWRKLGVDKILKKAYNQGIILSGLSAGAICWFRYGVSDSRLFIKNSKNKNWMRVSGLNFISLTVSPHHIRDKKIRDRGIREIMTRTPGVGLSMDDNTAIIIQDDRYKIIRSKNNTKIRKVFNSRERIIEIKLEDKGFLNDLVKY